MLETEIELGRSCDRSVYNKKEKREKIMPASLVNVSSAMSVKLQTGTSGTGKQHTPVSVFRALTARKRRTISERSWRRLRR